MEPIFFIPVYKDYIWGGKKLKNDLQKQTPFENTAESWEIADNKNGESIVKEGTYKGKTLGELFRSDEKISLFGTACEKENKFPLLIKFIDANQNLSVQVHPDDKYAKEIEEDTGKTEMWYIMDCEANSKLIGGLSEKVTQENKRELLTKLDIADCLEYISIEKGDILYIPSGTVHAILKGALICEIQQNSDLTYRLYDWNRIGKDGKPRQLHLQKALDVIQLDNDKKLIKTSKEEGKHTVLQSPYFTIEKFVVNGELQDTTDKTSFKTMHVVEGEGNLCCMNAIYPLKIGDSFLLPADLGSYTLKGNLQIISSHLS